MQRAGQMLDSPDARDFHVVTMQIPFKYWNGIIFLKNFIETLLSVPTSSTVAAYGKRNSLIEQQTALSSPTWPRARRVYANCVIFRIFLARIPKC